jgi:hypothetical protein
VNKFPLLALAAGALLLPSLPANAGDPPAEPRLYRFAGNDAVDAYVDFAALDRSRAEIHGWTYNIFNEPRAFEGMEAKVGSYWQEVGGDCRGNAVVNYGVELLDDKSQVLGPEMVNAVPQRREAAPGSFEEALLKKICSGAEPADETPFNTAKEAEDTVRLGDGLNALFGLDGN